ncbi:hypothetical protein BKA63DRAFT_507656 [Paraphoma chrysanthemicola]|nr:hypothetical protein BKA63DRAFT_507656 [Paraphoma chrysanthemicola]
MPIPEASTLTSIPLLDPSHTRLQPIFHLPRSHAKTCPGAIDTVTATGPARIVARRLSFESSIDDGQPPDRRSPVWSIFPANAPVFCTHSPRGPLFWASRLPLNDGDEQQLWSVDEPHVHHLWECGCMTRLTCLEQMFIMEDLSPSVYKFTEHPLPTRSCTVFRPSIVRCADIDVCCPAISDLDFSDESSHCVFVQMSLFPKVSVITFAQCRSSL